MEKTTPLSEMWLTCAERLAGLSQDLPADINRLPQKGRRVLKDMAETVATMALLADVAAARARADARRN